MERGDLDHNSAECSSISLSVVKMATHASGLATFATISLQSAQMCVLTFGFTAL